jgi:hypothetical protein
MILLGLAFLLYLPTSQLPSGSAAWWVLTGTAATLAVAGVVALVQRLREPPTGGY